VNKTEQAQQN